MRRRSPAWLLACLLALATGLALLRLSDLATEAPPWAGPVSADAGANAALVRGFYDAVNAALRTGRTADLDRLLAADFVAHGGRPGLPPTRAGFVRGLLALRATFPALQLRAQDVLAQGDVVVARVRVDGAARGTFLGLPLVGAHTAWGTVDVFRIAEGAIAEHWGGQHGAPVLEPFHEALLDVPLAELQTVSLERTTAAPGARGDVWAALGPEALSLESGRLTVAVAPDSGGVALRWRGSPAAGAVIPDVIAPGSEAAMAPGDLLLLAEGIRATVRNDADVAAVYLTIAVRVPGGPGVPAGPGGADAATGPPAATPGATTADLAGRPLLALPRGPALLGLGRATLAPGATLPVQAPGAALLAVEAGNLGLANTDGAVWSRRGADGAITTATDGILGAGDAVLVDVGARGDVRNAGDAPLVLLVVTITPAHPANGESAAPDRS